MATFQDVLIAFEARDNVSAVAQQIQSNIGGMGGGIRGTISELGGIFQGINGLIMGTFGMYGLSSFKNMTYGLSVAREEIKGLYDSTIALDENLAAAEMAHHEDLWTHMDNLTNNGYVSLDQLAQVMNVFRMSTHATGNDLYEMSDTIDMIGNYAIQMGKDENQVMNLMMSAAQGVNGNLDMLRRTFGLTKKDLQRLGWSGQKDDLEGYRKALEAYIGTSADLSNMMNSTQGQVISLQKRFRIAGRNIGNAYKPYIQAVMGAFSQLSAESDDLLIKLIILGTGGLSGFASILPTLSPMIQLYEFLDKRITLVGNSWKTTAWIFKATKLTPLTTSISWLISLSRSWIGVPLANYLKQLIDISNTPVGQFFTGLNRGIDTFIRSPILSKVTGIKNAFTGLKQSGVNAVLTKTFSTSGSLLGKYSNFIQTYGTLEQKALNATLRQRYYNLAVERGLVPLDRTKQTYLDLVAKADRYILSQQLETTATTENTVAQEGNILSRIANLLMKQSGAIVTAEDTISEEANTVSKVSNSIATMELSSLLALQTEIMVANAIASGVMTEAQIENTIALQAEAASAGEAGGMFGFLGAMELTALWPILLIVAALVGLFLIIDQIGKNLGWWDDWGGMIGAVWAGLQRLWSAFINNPDVQEFIQGLHSAFSQVGGVIQEVALAIMKLFGWKDDGSEFDLVRTLIDIFGALGRAISFTVKAFITGISVIWSVVGPGVTLIWNALKTVVCILVGCSPGIVPALQSVWNTFRQVFGGLVGFLTNPIGTIMNLLSGMNGNLFGMARNLGQSLWNGLNSILAGIPQKVLNTFWNMINNLKQIPNQIFNTAQEMGEGIYGGLDNAVAGATGGLIHLPGMGGNTKSTAQTVGNVNKNYSNVSKKQQGHTFNIGAGAIQLDARNLTTKESKQIMINALEGLTTYETVHTKKQTTGK